MVFQTGSFRLDKLQTRQVIRLHTSLSGYSDWFYRDYQNDLSREVSFLRRKYWKRQLSLILLQGT